MHTKNRKLEWNASDFVIYNAAVDYVTWYFISLVKHRKADIKCTRTKQKSRIQTYSILRKPDAFKLTFNTTFNISLFYTLFHCWLCRRHSWQMWLAKKDTPSPHGTWSHFWFSGFIYRYPLPVFYTIFTRWSGEPEVSLNMDFMISCVITTLKVNVYQRESDLLRINFIIIGIMTI